MGKRTTKANSVLMEAQSRLNVARINVATAEREAAQKEQIASEARAVVYALQDMYDALNLAFAPKPRSNGSGSAAKPKRASKAAATTICSTCGENFDHVLHDPKGGYAGYHPFTSSSAAPNAKKRSSSASASKKGGEANILVNNGSVSTASNVEGNPNEAS